ncbi:PREDICTED: GPN-loop GTPase 2-like isoform X2 [Priapulus caudatus]|uniref:GPN-loop GTPase 2 n=1 Tax=Priapulus caudatus TaxID=37621 RepID=A0ABM1ERT8_PRICU|nr:PREDICTED: GPN-loop GTPase 2-like isoform X2 [Priapulus caudatus]
MGMFGQVVVGPPGSGKSTYCTGLQDLLTQLGRKVMDSLKLGPNGGLIFCMEYLEKNMDWLKSQLDRYKDHYFLFDCPGQVELYTHHTAIKNIFAQLVKWDFRLASVHLVDSHYCSDPTKFIAVLLTSLATMLQVELPHVNVLSKVDLIQQFGKLPFNIDFYTEVLDLSYVMEAWKDDPLTSKFKKFNEALCGVIEDYSLVSFHTLAIQDRESVLRLLKTVDKANGYIFGDKEQDTLYGLMSSAVGAEFEYFKTADVRERYMADDETEKPMEEGEAVKPAVEAGEAEKPAVEAAEAVGMGLAS